MIENEGQQQSLIRRKFIQYELLRRSGLTNMWDTERVSQLSGGLLKRSDVIWIIRNYEMLKGRFAHEQKLPEQGVGEVDKQSNDGS